MASVINVTLFQATCSPQSVESDTIKACICTTDLCRSDFQRDNQLVGLNTMTNTDYSGIGDDDSGPRTALATFDSTVTAPPPNIDQEVENFHRII